MRRGLQPAALAAQPPAPSMDSRVTPASFPAHFAAGTFIQIRSGAAAASCVSSSSQVPGVFALTAEGGQPAGGSLYCTPHGPAGRTALLQPALGGGGGRPPVIPPHPRGRAKGTLGLSFPPPPPPLPRFSPPFLPPQPPPPPIAFSAWA
uniref:Uncharacterized protein n=1 Tax=Terrapene triunguis TaxID=2587831 RepID=A0A674HZJ8_9SAUR